MHLSAAIWPWDAGKLDAGIPLVVYNHPDLASRVKAYGLPFRHLPVSKETKAEQEAEVLDLLSGHGVDLIVLACYMQILTPGSSQLTRTA